MSMFFVFIFTLILVYIYMRYNFKEEVVRWGILFIFCGGLGSLHLILLKDVYSPLHLSGKLNNPLLNYFLYNTIILIALVSQTVYYYAQLMFALIYVEFEWLNSKKRRYIAAAVLFIPVILTFVVTPFSEEKLLNSLPMLDYHKTVWWVLPYNICAIFLLLRAYLNERDRWRKRGYLQSIIILAPVIVGVTFINLVAKVIYDYPRTGNYTAYLPYVFAYGILMYLTFTYRNGLFGIKLKLEKQVRRETFRAIITSSAMLNHAIKNKIGNVNLLSERILDTSSDAAVHNDVKLILSQNEDILAMIQRIQKQIGDIQIVQAIHNINGILEKTIEACATVAMVKNIRIFKNWYLEASVSCDIVHMQEVFANIIKNAIESMKSGEGVHKVSLFASKKSLIIEFSDNGVGISKENRDRIFDPFFSTKGNEKNYGLGLSYCYLVLEKHGYTMHVKSTEGKGTTFSIMIPKKNVMNIAYRRKKDNILEPV